MSEVFSLDLIGAALSLTATLLYVVQSVWAWPVSLVAIAISSTLFFKLGIYADFILQLIYAVLCIYGWVLWRKGALNHLTVRHVEKKFIIPGLLICAIGIAIVYQLLLLLNSTVAFMDAFTAVFSILGQWLTAKKLIECWVIWFVVDAVYIFLYALKVIPFHSILLFIYCFIAIAGYWRWKRTMNEI